MASFLLRFSSLSDSIGGGGGGGDGNENLDDELGKGG